MYIQSAYIMKKISRHW